MKVTKTQLQKIVLKELKYQSKKDKRISKNTVLEIDVDTILLEQRELDEGRLGALAKALATKFIPGGRFVSDYSQARGFDELEEFSEEAEDRLADLDARLSAIEGAIASLGTP